MAISIFFKKIFYKICVAYFFQQVAKLFPQKRSVTCVFIQKITNVCLFKKEVKKYAQTSKNYFGGIRE
jgi:hypothetical protein